MPTQRSVPFASARRALLRAAGLAGAAAGGLLPAIARSRTADFPTQPVRVVLPFPPGTTLDAPMRLVAERFRAATGQSMLLEHKPGASGNIAAQTVARARPDGYTLLVATQGILTLNPHLFATLPYDPVRDFRPITRLMSGNLYLVVESSTVPARTLAEFVDWTRRQPSEVPYASLGAGSPSHFVGVILERDAGARLLHVPYKGAAQAVQDLVARQVPSAFLPGATIATHVRARRVHVLATTASARTTLLPEVPTFRELGLDRLDVQTWSALVAPAGTPDPVVERLAAETIAAIRSPEFLAAVAVSDQQALPSTAAELERLVQVDSERWQSAIRSSGFRLDAQ